MYECGGVIPDLSGRRVRLQAMAQADAGALFEIWQHPAVAPWLNSPPLSSARDAEALIALLAQMACEEESLRWSIRGPGGEVIGSCGFNYWQLQGAYRGEIGFELSPAAVRQGYMREALELILDFGFGTMGLNRIEALCHPDNFRAGKLVTGLGFKKEGLLREYLHTSSGYQDAVMYALLRGEQLPRREYEERIGTE
ncbi:GNAT family protein [Paenibacillus sp. MMS20-IR301]|uniref:GNAT family N-acetyltransferase n=1 Tax=Paenibacillus sp. MMS20-IR301 TaxID=2895946 RepID=UPI0028E4A17E|nr:GNAT family protein [Paenibacillus sp. MMS20-IR301]WNS41673.1 GNAT family protein [Paenibacillus sp. MMS20-IR301]